MNRPTALLSLLLTCTVAAQTRGPLDLATAQVPRGARTISYGSDPLSSGNYGSLQREVRTQLPSWFMEDVGSQSWETWTSVRWRWTTCAPSLPR